MTEKKWMLVYTKSAEHRGYKVMDLKGPTREEACQEARVLLVGDPESWRLDRIGIRDYFRCKIDTDIGDLGQVPLEKAFVVRVEKDFPVDVLTAEQWVLKEAKCEAHTEKLERAELARLQTKYEEKAEEGGEDA